jgi:hypothetical protein
MALGRDALTVDLEINVLHLICEWRMWLFQDDHALFAKSLWWLTSTLDVMGCNARKRGRDFGARFPTMRIGLADTLYGEMDVKLLCQ